MVHQWYQWNNWYEGLINYNQEEKMNRKLVALAMAGVLGVSSLTGCGSNAKKEQASSGGKTEVEFWYSGGKTAVGVVQQIIDDFNKSQEKYKVKAVTQADYDETYKKLEAGIAGKAAPDLVLLNAEAARSISDKDLVADLNDLEKDDKDFNKDNYIETFLKQGEDGKGKIFGIPAYGTTQVMYYNIEAFKKAGVDPTSIKTWKDLGDAAAKIKAKGYEYGWEPMWGAQNLIDAVYSNNGKMFSDDGKKVTINTPEWVNVWQQFGNWIHKDKIMGIHSGGQGWEYWYKTIDDVLQNKAGGYTGSSGDQGDLNFKIVAAMQQPAWSSSTKSAPMAEAKILSILKGSSDEKRKGAYEFMKYFTNVESQVKWTTSTGYVAVNKKINDNKKYQEFLKSHPQAKVPFEQATHGSINPYDPTHGAVLDALKIAADKVEIDGSSAQEALDQAQKTAQDALDQALGGK